MAEHRLPAVVGGDDHSVAHTGPSQTVAQVPEQAVEQRLQRQDQEEDAHKEAAGGLQRTGDMSSLLRRKL